MLKNRRRRKLNFFQFLTLTVVKLPWLWAILLVWVIMSAPPRTVNNYFSASAQDIPTPTPPRNGLEEIADLVAKANDISQILFRALITQESAWNAQIVSPAGAIGLGQVMPFNAPLCGITAVDLTEPEANLRCSAKILKEALAYWKGDIDYALGEYNAGRDAVKTRNALKEFKETRLYVARIKAIVAGMQTPIPCHSKECLRMKENASAGGDSLPKLFELAEAIQSNVSGIIWFSGFNDGYQPRIEKGHDEGRAMDCVLVWPERRAEVITAVRNLASDLNLSVRIVDEYERTKGTGGHLHIELNGGESI